ncbi:unnamed protein product [Meganyctiphanes norvegica]|uniref:Phospholipid/glycerol acyltransferase domain-containing protein n=1 Tax=Meganyctiphanes norvegica TaxID=48144 RepID=A0AAV2Q3M9_MEGNR
MESTIDTENISVNYNHQESKNSFIESEYVDLVAERREYSDLRFALQEWEPLKSYKYGTPLERTEIFNTVLHSERVNYIITQLVLKGKPRDEVEAEVSNILDQMGHTQDIAIIRRFAFMLPKIMKSIYGKVLVNRDGIEKVRNVLEETPLVLLPTHRSYADFLLVSYMSYHLRLPMPVIAAGMDFMSMSIIGDMLRGSGAFYIRRSFVDNSLYWAVFQEYVQTLIKDVGSPLEFFLEGTRSRSGKSLPPKVGLLGCVSELWLRGRVPDLALVPISISYERTLEERLYAYELLGVPKPPESTSGLLKAMSILKESFGDIIINIGTPVSLRSYLSPHADRHLYMAQPRHLLPLTRKELYACEGLGLHVLRQIQCGAVCSVWSLICVGLIQELQRGCTTVPLHQLVQEVDWLATLICKMGGTCTLKGPVDEEVKQALSVHCQVAALGSDGTVHIQQVHLDSYLPTQCKSMALEPSTVSSAVSHMMLQHYVNQAMHHFIRPALVAQAILALRDPAPSLDKIESRFRTLCSIFNYDFIFEKSNEKKDLSEGIAILVSSGEVRHDGNHVNLIDSKSPLLNLLQALLRPFLLAYRATLHTLVAGEYKNNNELVSASQRKVEEMLTNEIQASSFKVYSALTLDSLRHAARAFTKLGIVDRHKGEDGSLFLQCSAEKADMLNQILTDTQFRPLLQAHL